MDRITKALELARQSRDTIDDEAKGRDKVVRVDRSPAAGARSGASIPPHRADLDLDAAHVHRVAPSVAEKHRLVMDAAHPAAAAYKVLRTQVMQRMQARGWQVLGVTSPAPDEGKTVSAINLALALAADPAVRVMLVDLDLRRASLGDALGMSPAVTLDGVLRGGADLAALPTRIQPGSGLYVLPSATAGYRSAELLGGDRCREVIATLRELGPNTIVICDLPPVLVADDALVAGRLMDAALMVVSEGQTRREDVTRSIELLDPLPIAGTALNKSRERTRYIY